MGNTLRKLELIENTNEYSDYRESLEENQNFIKFNVNNEFYNDLMRIAFKIDYENIEAVPVIERRIKKEILKDYSMINDLSEDSIMEYKSERKYIDTIKKNNDFICAYIVEEDINCVWIIIENSVLEFNKVYFKAYDDFKRINKCDFKIMIFDSEDLDEVKEEIKNLKSSEEIIFNG